jgi:hypothetical protein
MVLILSNEYLGWLFRVARNGVQTNQGVQVRMHLSSFIHLNTVGTSERLEKKRKGKMETWASEHRRNNTMVMSAEEKRVANVDPREISICTLPNSERKTVTKEEPKVKEYKKERKEECEEEGPDNPPCVEEQEPPEDGWFCPQCSESPCQFLQWQEELERIVDVMNPDL